MQPLLRLAALALLPLVLSTAAEPPAQKPNIILIITDDQGYGELSCHGNPIVKTPHIDQLAKESVRLTDFHVAPMCTPTRGQLMTGIDCFRNGAMNVSSGRTLLRREFPTLADVLKAAGYATGQFGKWHLGDNYPFRPHDRGFDESIWYPSSHIGSTSDFWENDYFDDTYWHRGQRQRYEGYTTDVFFREATNWIKSQRQADPKKPVFAYLATASAHGPLYVPEKYRDAVRPRLKAALSQLPSLNANEQEQLVRYLAMVENIDENLGRLEAFLDAEKMRDNTIVIFLTDNGSTWGPRYFNAGMTGGKVTLWEGGHRVPCFIRWPNGKLGTPRDEASLTQVQDLLPTLAELTGAAAPKTDGLSLAPLLRGETPSLPDRMFVINYSRMPVPGRESDSLPAKEGAAVLWNRWRLLEDKALYDLATDPRQQRDVAAQHPEIVQKMRSHLQTWWEGVQPRVNEPSRVVIGNNAENPLMLTACEWFDVFIDQQAQVRRGELKSGTWHLEVAEPGDYEIELRRWPREANLALSAASPAKKLTDGQLAAGVALPIATASLEIGGQSQSLDLATDATSAQFRIHLNRGPTQLKTTFSDAANKPLLGAYYVYVNRLPATASLNASQPAKATSATLPVQQRTTTKAKASESARWIPIQSPQPASGIQIHGLPWFTVNNGDFGRLLLSAQSTVPAAVWSRSREPSGARIRFRSNTTSLSLRLQAEGKLAQRSTMSDQASRGLDVYADGAYWKSVTISSAEEHERVAFTGVERRERDITIYLPVGQALKAISIGVDAAATVSAPPSFTQSKPIVFYGSSVAQGIGISRPGMTYEAILARKLNTDFVNLGFSGAGKAEPAVIDLIASVDACCYVFDLGRSYGDQDKTAYKKMLTTVRAKRPGTPLVCVLSIYNPAELHDQSWKSRTDHTRKVFREVYEELKPTDPNLHLVAEFDLIKPTEGDTSNEAVHPSDFGYFLMAERLSPILKPLLP